MSKIDDAIRYTYSRISKYNRTKLLKAIIKSYNCKHIDYFDIMQVCDSIEKIHNASLIIDDLPLFDNDSIRDGVATTHSVYGEQIALLSAISIIFDCFKNDLSKKIIDELCNAGILMCKGQSLEFEDEIDISQYHALKTGSMFTSICRIGAIMCDKNPNDWNDFAYNLGLAYQLADDLDDIDQDNGYNIAKEIKDINIDQYINNIVKSIPHDADEEVIILFLNQCLNKVG